MWTNRNDSGLILTRCLARFKDLTSLRRCNTLAHCCSRRNRQKHQYIFGRVKNIKNQISKFLHFFSKHTKSLEFYFTTMISLGSNILSDILFILQEEIFENSVTSKLFLYQNIQISKLYFLSKNFKPCKQNLIELKLFY